MSWIYGIYFWFLSMILLSSTPHWLFDLLQIPRGYRSGVIVAVLWSLGLIVFFRASNRKVIAAELILTVLPWLFWLAYAASRMDFSSGYAVKKFQLVLLTQFSVLLTVVVTYCADSGKFEKWFGWVNIAVSVALLVKLAADPSTFVYAGSIERLTIEDVNPIWLARAFAIGAFCVLRFPGWRLRWKAAAALPFITGIVLTGSRGPLVGLGLVMVAANWRTPTKSLKSMAVAGVGFAVVTVAVYLLLPLVQPGVTGYFSRGSERGMFEESGRLAGYSLALQDFASSPVLGVGWGRYGASRRGSVVWRPEASDARNYPHNVFLEVLAETGFLGLVLFVLLFRPGRWMLMVGNPFWGLFALTAIFASTSGDLTGNPGIYLLGFVARATKRRQVKDPSTVPATPLVERGRLRTGTHGNGFCRACEGENHAG